MFLLLNVWVALSGRCSSSPTKTENSGKAVLNDDINLMMVDADDGNDVVSWSILLPLVVLPLEVEVGVGVGVGV